MKTRNPNLGRARDVTLGRAAASATSGRLNAEDTHGNEATGHTHLYDGATVTDLDDGLILVTIDEQTGDGLTQDEADQLYLTRGSGERHVAETITAGTAQTLDLSTANTFDVTLTADCTFTFSNPPDTGVEGRWTIALRQDATGGWEVTWPATVAWRDTDGTQTTTAPTLATAAGAVDTVDLRTLDGGTTYGASLENGTGGLISEITIETAGHYEVLMDGSGTAEPLEDGSGADWLYVWVP